MMQRVQTNADSDTTLFSELLYAGEFIIKATVAAFVASLDDDTSRSRYSSLYQIVRADGLGSWVDTLSNILRPPFSASICEAFHDTMRTFTKKVSSDSWQHDAVTSLLACIDVEPRRRSTKAQLLTWFTKFSELRNKTRGHGAITPAYCATYAPILRNSIQLLIDNNPIFIDVPWAYFHRNWSGRYNIVNLAGDDTVFGPLRTSSGESENYANGIYLWAQQPRRVELLHTDLDATDFFVPNGNFNGKTYELHSLITDNRRTADAKPYLTAPNDLPSSHTSGTPTLEVVGETLTNMPPLAEGYVSRPLLETATREALINDRHAIVTLVGRGGIGKTSLVLALLHQIAKTRRYDVIVWFSSRDIDLAPSGPKDVSPSVLSDEEIAQEYVRLTETRPETPDDPVNPLQIMASHMHRSPNGPTLFVFDNFETVRSPLELFKWIDTNIRHPNKAIITSRFREFKADYPIEVLGMEYDEASKLLTQTAQDLGIAGLVDQPQRDRIIEESRGHPYVIKIVLGEVDKKGRFEKPNNVIWHRDDILDALFERTYENLRPLSERIFLMLSGWRSLVPQLAVEAVILSGKEADVDPRAAIDELVRMSLVERAKAPDDSEFLSVPLAAELFGTKKLKVSSNRQLIEMDLELVREFGPTLEMSLKEGLRRPLTTYCRKIAGRKEGQSDWLEKRRPVLEFIARDHAPAWLMIADLEIEVDGELGLERSASCIRRFLQQPLSEEESRTGWRRMLSVYGELGDVIGACSAFLEAAKYTTPTLFEASEMANDINGDRDVLAKLDTGQRGALLRPLASLFERHVEAASATDLSRLAWLYLHAGDVGRAEQYVNLGLAREPHNHHCQKLDERLSSSGWGN